MHTLARLIIVLIGFGGMLGATGVPVAPGESHTEPTRRGRPLLTVQPASNYAHLDWDGRTLNMLEVGVRADIYRALTVGAFFRDAGGRGRSAGTRYDAEGYRFVGEVPVYREQRGLPAFSLFAEYLSDDVVLRVDNPSLEAELWPIASSTGYGVQARAHRGGTTWHARIGQYDSKVNEQRVTSVLLAGGGVDIPLATYLHGSLDITAFHEDYAGGFTALELAGEVILLHASRGRLTLGGHYFPRGIPMGGTTFSPTSSIGLLYGDAAATQLRSHAMGYLELAGEITF